MSSEVQSKSVVDTAKTKRWVDVRPLTRGELENMLNTKLLDWQWARVENYVLYRKVIEE